MDEIQTSEPNTSSQLKNLDHLREYRDCLENDIIEDSKNYHTTITYVAAGALGLLLTINEKFLHITDGTGNGFLLASIIFLILTLALFIIISIMNIRRNEILRDHADSMIEAKNITKKLS